MQKFVHEVEDPQPEVREVREGGQGEEVLKEHLGEREGGREGGKEAGREMEGRGEGRKQMSALNSTRCSVSHRHCLATVY